MIKQSDLRVGMVFKRSVGLREERIKLVTRNKDIPLDRYGRWEARDTETGSIRMVSEASLICCWDLVKNSE